MARNLSRNEIHQSEENEFEDLLNSTRCPPLRSPLNSIPDPSQLQTGNHGPNLDFGEKFEVPRAQQHRSGRISNHSTPRVSNRYGKIHSEPNYTQSTPGRNGPRVSLGGGSISGARVAQSIGGREMSSSSRISRGTSGAEIIEVPHFELNEDPLFWNDHNVQALIRIRPLSTMERISQGYDRCLKQETPQTLVWLGHPETRFTFDHVACETISQEKLFEVAGLPMVENCLSGYNSCMFAYGQTGSGKTYTMMGEISEAEGKLNQDCGITPRIFKYLFSRIKTEEESRRDDKLKFSCKCSFLELYNEQITDLLEPSSTNLQLREDLVKGVYVENLTEHNVRTVDDVLKLLIQGTANRKIAATHMNSESSRSHSVFTCIIESQWEKDSLTHFRFARLNLVDLAGSERQKSSGAEGDRLKEAANINKSLSTLGLVIMSLVDLAHGKHRHVPYRDSRLTFLLQDSLGGNSKTMIVANVSPSLCSANETLSTLKFAQRAKLIQNNAKVNEDASGDITALQREIKALKGQLSSLMKNQRFFASHSIREAGMQESHSSGHRSTLTKKVVNIEKILASSLRREKAAEAAIQKLEAEIEHISRLASQREEDAQCFKMMLRFREEKIKQLEGLICSVPNQTYPMEENKLLKEEIKLLQERIDKNPEVTRFALENIKLHEQLQLYQNLYEQGEHEILLGEIAELRNQLLDFLEGKGRLSSRCMAKDTEMEKELESSRNTNANLIRELDELRREVGNHFSCNQTTSDSVTDSSSKDSKQFGEVDKCSLEVETMSKRSDFGDEMTSYKDDHIENKNATKLEATPINHHDDLRKELMDSKSLVEAMEAEQVQLINELRLVWEENRKYREILCTKDIEIQSLHKLHVKESGNLGFEKLGSAAESDALIDTEALQTKLQKVCQDLTKAKVPDCQYKEGCLSQSSEECDIELVREQVETETARTILYLQEELTALESELQNSMCNMNEENERLKGIITAKDTEIRALNLDWEKATVELTSFIADGSKSVKDASMQIQSIVCSFPHVNSWISDYVEKAARICIEKEETVLLLQKSLEDAQVLLVDMELKLNSLKGATVALNELQWKENVVRTEDSVQLSVQKDENLADKQDNGLKPKKDESVVAEKCAKAEVAFTKWLYDLHKVSERNYTNTNTCTLNSVEPIGGGANMFDKKLDDNLLKESDISLDGALRSLKVEECEHIIHASVGDIQVLLASSEMDVLKVYSECKDLVQHVIREIYELRCEFLTLKDNTKDIRRHKIELQPKEAGKCLVFENQCQMLCQIKDELAESCNKLNSISNSINVNQSVKSLLFNDEYLSEAYGTSDDYSISSSDSSTDSADLEDSLASYCFHGRQAEQTLDIKSQGDSAPDEQKIEENKECVQTLALGLRKELDEVSDALNKMYVQLNSLLNENYLGISSHDEVRKRSEKDCKASDVAISVQTIDHTESFFDKFKNVSGTMKEADLLLNELVKANESSKMLTGMWRQAGEELMEERTSMIGELEQLRSSVAMYKGENQSLLSFVHSTLTEVANSVSLLEENFLQLKGGVDETIKVLYSDIQSNGQEMLKFIGNSVSFVEHMISQSMEQGFTLFVIHQCLISKLMGQIPNMDEQYNALHFRLQEKSSWMDNNRAIYLSVRDDTMSAEKGDIHVCNQTNRFKNFESEEVCKSHNCLSQENFFLKKELQRKEALLEGLFFDFKLLQESASHKKDMKDDIEKMIVVLCQFQRELDLQTSQVDDLVVQKRKHEICLDDIGQALSKSNSDLELAKQRIDALTEQNAELRVLVKDLYMKKSVAEKGLEEQKEVVEGLEKEILSLASSTENQLLSSVKGIEENLRNITDERDQLAEVVRSLDAKLENAYALVDEKEALAVEAHQESEASKIYAQQKEEEVKILEHSIEELECTVNVLERRVYDMDAEVERHRITRDSLEIELEDLRQRFLNVENLRDKSDATNVVIDPSGNQMSRSQELYDVQNQLQMLERERTEQNKEIKRYKEYISEILLHTEAQASQYQEKYKTLEAMVREVKTEVSSSSLSATTLPRAERSSSRPRGSSSPFRCIAGLVQQLDSEKDQELNVARHRIEELGTLLESKQKELCKLNTRLAASESMTHDVIRELLGVKLDLTSYANLIDQYQVQRLVEDAFQHSEEILSKEQEIKNLKSQISDLSQEKENCISYIHKKEAEMLTNQISLERLRERDQLLSAQNDMLKKDKTNLLMRVSELDQMVKALFDPKTSERRRVQEIPKSQENAPRKLIDIDYTTRLQNAQKLLSHANNELAKYRRPSSSTSHTSARAQEQSFETRYRRSKS